MNNAVQENLQSALQDMENARNVLEYSYNKCRRIIIEPGLSPESLESLEALTSRFARLGDLIIQKVFRLVDMFDLEEPGTVRDRINRAEKKGLITSADQFIELRMLRNEIAHDYKSDTILSLFEKVLNMTPVLLQESQRIADQVHKRLQQA